MPIAKKDLIEFFGGQAAAAAKLGYSTTQSIYHFPEVLSTKQQKTVLMRMRAARCKIPEGWTK